MLLLLNLECLWLFCVFLCLESVILHLLLPVSARTYHRRTPRTLKPPTPLFPDFLLYNGASGHSCLIRTFPITVLITAITGLLPSLLARFSPVVSRALASFTHPRDPPAPCKHRVRSPCPFPSLASSLCLQGACASSRSCTFNRRSTPSGPSDTQMIRAHPCAGMGQEVLATGG